VTEISLPYSVARPVSQSPAPGVIVTHESTGITTSLLRFCQRLAAEGYLVVAPDLFFRVGGTEAADYETLAGSLTPGQVQGDMQEMVAVLQSIGATSVATIGFCLGGSISYQMATQTDLFAAAIGFYGFGKDRPYGTPNCPLQLFFGARDPWYSTEFVNDIVAHHPETIVYQGAGHGFMRDRRRAYDGSDEYVPDAAADAWRRSIAFLREHLT
jgi:carboxymethylenebutenolidase